MKALVLNRISDLREVDDPLDLVELPKPEPGPGEIRIRVAACGVCHTELDEIEGRAAPPELPVVLGHEVVGRVDVVGREARKFKEGDRVGVGWIFSSTGAEDENLSEEFRATGRDANGGYAEYMTVPENYAYPIPAIFRDVEAAPLLCAGAIGYRALRLANLENGQRLGLTGFGGSAHLVLPLARRLYPDSEICVFARSAETHAFARELGADWAGDYETMAPEPLDAIIDTTPVWKPVLHGLSNLNPGGRLVINAIRKESVDREELLELSYHDQLWMEREIKSVANITSRDIAEFLPLAAEIPLRPQVFAYPLEDANRALVELRRERVEGAKVLVMDG